MTTRQFTAYALVLLMPFGAALPLAQPFAPGVYWLYVTPALEVTDAAALLLVLLAVVAPRRPARPPTGINVVPLLAALTALGALSVLRAWQPSLAGVCTARWALAAAVCWALIDTDLPLERLVAVFVAAVVLQSVVAIFQALRQAPLGLPGELVPALDLPGVSIVTLGPGRWLRAYGLTFHPNVLGGFLSVGLILSLPLLGSRMAQLAWCVMSVALLATFSRSAWIATALIVPPVAVWVWRHERRTRGLAITLLIAVMALSAAGWIWRDFIVARIAPDATASTAAAIVDHVRRDERIGLNAVALRVIAAHPLLGIGAGSSPLAEQRAHLAPQYPHNVALMLATEVGVGGGLVWLALMVLTAWRLTQSPRTTWLVAGVAALAALQIIALLDCYPWSLNGGRLLTVTVLAIIETAARQAPALMGCEAPPDSTVHSPWCPRRPCAPESET
jgi:O-antigen ligase